MEIRKQYIIKIYLIKMWLYNESNFMFIISCCCLSRYLMHWLSKHCVLTFRFNACLSGRCCLAVLLMDRWQHFMWTPRPRSFLKRFGHCEHAINFDSFTSVDNNLVCVNFPRCITDLVKLNAPRAVCFFFLGGIFRFEFCCF